MFIVYTLAALGAGYLFWPPSLRQKVVLLASKQVGVKDPTKFWQSALPNWPKGQPYPKEWCGGFNLWALHNAGLAKDWYWEIGDNSGFLFRLPKTNNPKPGDTAYFAKFQHHAIVKAVKGDTVTLLNGNGTGDAVTETTIPLSKATAYYSIEPLVSKKAA